MLVVTFGLGACATTDAPPVEAPTTVDTGAAAPSEPAGSGPDDLPGERTEIYPYEGDELAVRGVAVDDVLNVRSGPGVEFEVVAELVPLADGMVATGHNRTVDGSLWVEMDADGVVGWANAVYLAQLGQVTDITSELPGLPSGDDMAQLAELVARDRAPADDGGLEPTITLVDGPRTGDLVDATVDVTGYADDAVVGERLHVLADAEGGVLTVRNVEATVLCLRGVSDDGLCV